MSEASGQRIERFVFSGLRHWQSRFTEDIPITMEEVHALQVFCKQLRGLLGLYRKVAPKRPVEKLRKAARLLAESFSGQRDREAQQQLFKVYAEQFLSDTETVVMQTLLSSNDAANSNQDMHLSETKSLLDEIESRWKKKLRPLEEEQILNALIVSRKKEHRCFRRLRTEQDFHRWRKWVNYTYYQLDAVLECPNKVQTRQIKDLQNMGSLLSKFNDLCLLDVYCQQGLWCLKKPKRYLTAIPDDIVPLPDEVEMLRTKLHQLLQQVRQDGQQLAVKCSQLGEAFYKLPENTV